MPLDGCGCAVLRDLEKPGVALLLPLLLVEMLARLPTAVMLLYPNRGMVALVLDLFVAPLALNEVRSPMSLLQDPQLIDPFAISPAALDRLDLRRSINTLFVPMILQRQAVPLALHATPVKGLDPRDPHDKRLRPDVQLPLIAHPEVRLDLNRRFLP